MGITSPHRHEQKIMQMKVTSEQAKQLLTDQLSVWESARDNYKALEAVQVKELTVEGCTVKIQFNPARIVSSAAKVDTQSLKERKCFLCAENRPEVQEGLPDGSYTWLINPFPIFPEHFTIPVNEHLPQLIEKRFGDMLRLAHAAEHYVLFYNGPKCGASAPDHAHFQAGNKGFLPLEKELKKYRRIPIRTEKSARLSQVEDYICPFFLIEAESEETAEKLFGAHIAVAIAVFQRSARYIHDANAVTPYYAALFRDLVFSDHRSEIQAGFNFAIIVGVYSACRGGTLERAGIIAILYDANSSIDVNNTCAGCAFY